MCWSSVVTHESAFSRSPFPGARGLVKQLQSFYVHLCKSLVVVVHLVPRWFCYSYKHGSQQDLRRRPQGFHGIFMKFHHDFLGKSRNMTVRIMVKKAEELYPPQRS